MGTSKLIGKHILAICLHPKTIPAYQGCSRSPWTIFDEIFFWPHEGKRTWLEILIEAFPCKPEWVYQVATTHLSNCLLATLDERRLPQPSQCPVLSSQMRTPCITLHPLNSWNHWAYHVKATLKDSQRSLFHSEQTRLSTAFAASRIVSMCHSGSHFSFKHSKAKAFSSTSSLPVAPSFSFEKSSSFSPCLIVHLPPEQVTGNENMTSCSKTSLHPNFVEKAAVAKSWGVSPGREQLEPTFQCQSTSLLGISQLSKVAFYILQQVIVHECKVASFNLQRVLVSVCRKWGSRQNLGSAIASVREHSHGHPLILGSAKDPIPDVIACTAGCTQGTACIPHLQTPALSDMDDIVVSYSCFSLRVKTTGGHLKSSLLLGSPDS